MANHKYLVFVFSIALDKVVLQQQSSRDKAQETETKYRDFAYVMCIRTPVGNRPSFTSYSPLHR